MTMHRPNKSQRPGGPVAGEARIHRPCTIASSTLVERLPSVQSRRSNKLGKRSGHAAAERRKGCAGRSVTRTVLGCWLGWELKRRVTYPRMHAASDDRAVVQACRGWGHGHERTEAGGAGPVGRTKARHIHSPAIAADSPNFPRARSAWEEIGGGWG
jgi:hypothetical protein